MDKHLLHVQKNNLLESIVTRCGLPKTPLQEVRYDYDRHYNLIQRNDITLSKNETFRYDDLDRLTDIRLNGGEGNSIWYQANGNIFQKYDVGRYIYDPIRPFAVSYIGSASKGISDTEQRLTYNAYNKVTLVAQGDTQYSIVYGLDRQRIESMLKDKGKVKYTRLYMGSYERKTSANGVVTHVDYIYAPTGLAAIHKRTGTRQGIYYVLTDNIGSVSVVTDGFGNIINRYYYTAWGGRVRTDNGEYDHATYFGDEGGDVTDRGYTCHEHLAPLNLIDMNGRIYDPVLARFLSPDPYIQAPDFTQNYNRYAYCLNNPFKYTDPSGEIAWFVIPLITAGIFAVGNTVAHSVRGDVGNFWSGLKYFGQGALTGFALGCAWEFAPAITWLGLGQGIQTAMTVYTYGKVIEGVVGTAVGAFNGGWKGVGNGAKTFLGNFYLDENEWLGGIWQGFSRHTWEMLQSFVGEGYTHVKNAFGEVDRVDYFGGATFATKENSESSFGVSIGNYINVNIKDKIKGKFDDRVISDPLFMHEYGHTLDSRLFGISYLFVIGIPSIISAVNSTLLEDGGVTTHDFRWYEMRANRHAAKYFKKYFGVDWEKYEKEYPRKRRYK